MNATPTCPTRRRRLSAALGALFVAVQASASGFFAGQLDDGSLHRLPPGGMDAIGGRGDWLLTDGELCAVISGAEHPTYLAAHGAALVDLWHCARGNDQWIVAHGQLNLQKDQIPVTDAITAGYGSGDAWVQTRGSRDGLQMTVRYRLQATRPGVLAVATEVSRLAPGKDLGMFGALILHPSGALTPFTVDTADATVTRGFEQPAIDTTDPLSILQAVSSADTQLLLGSRQVDPPISYAIRTETAEHRGPGGAARPVHRFLISGRTFTLFGAFTQPFPALWPRTPGMVSFALGQWFDLDVGESLVFRQSITASLRGDAASLLDTLYDGPQLGGRLDTAEAGIVARDRTGRDLNFARPDAQGYFSLRLPAGIDGASLLVRTPWGESQTLVEATADTDLGRLDSGAPGILDLPRAGPMGLTFLGAGPRPVFHDELASARVGGARQLSGAESHHLYLGGTPQDLRSVRLPPGDYRVLASRGPEFSVTESRVRLQPGQRQRLEIEPPQRVVNTPDLIGADLHVHSGVSFDSSLAPRQRVIEFAAQGGEVLVPTEHNISYDLRPAIDALGLGAAILSFPGVEITGMARSPAAPTTIGHSNVFPVTAERDAFMGGTLPFEGRRLGEVIDAYKQRFPGSIFQLNHPRSRGQDEDLAFFNHLSQGVAFDPSLPLTSPPNDLLLERHAGSDYRDIDFDAIELLNGPDMVLYEAVRADWFALLAQGVYKVATANSDSHVSSELVAYPRNYLVVENDDPATARPEAIVDAIRRGALYGSTGPLVTVDLDGTGPGGTHRSPTGTLTVAVDAAPWIEVEQVVIWLNGARWRTLPAGSGARVSADLTVSEDSYVFVEVWGSPTEIYRAVVPGHQPFAFANPVFIDVEGDGWRAGGAPAAAAAP